MKKQSQNFLSLLSFSFAQWSLVLMFLLTVGASRLFAQKMLPFGMLKKNGVSVAPLPAFGGKKEIHLGFERLLNDRNSLRLQFGFNYKNADPKLETFRRETLVHSEFRGCEENIVWFFIIPIGYENTCASPSADVKARTVKAYETAHFFGDLGYRFYFAPFYKSKVINGLYIEPGLRTGTRSTVSYTTFQGDSTTVDDVTSEVDIDGLPFILVGSTGTDIVQKIDRYQVDAVEKAADSDAYFQPNLKAGMQIAIGNFLSLDLGGQAFFQKGGHDAQAKLKFSPALRVGGWF